MGILTADHLRLRDMVRAFADNEVAPIAGDIDRADGQIPQSLVEKMGELGFYGMCLPEEYGGGGGDVLSLCIVTEELCRAWLSAGSQILRNAVTGHVLQLVGTPEQKERWLPKMATGELQTAHAGTEPEAGSDAANIKTRAVRDGDVYRVTGSKQFITNADRADLLFMYVRTSDESKHGGVSVLVVEKEPGTEFIPPYLTGRHIPTAGYHGMHTWALQFNDLEVPAENLLGGVEGQGFRQLMQAYEIGRITLGFRCIGLAQAAFEAARDYSLNRVQFDQPISKFQAVRFRLADMATEIEATRSLGYLLAQRFDEGGRLDLEAGMLKLYAAEMVRKVCYEALFIHGGIGYTTETDVNRYWRDSVLMPIGEGTSDIQREVIARKILGERK